MMKLSDFIHCSDLWKRQGVTRSENCVKNEICIKINKVYAFCASNRSLELINVCWRQRCFAAIW